MERTMSIEEKVKKAEEIYYRRNNLNNENIKQPKKVRKNMKLFNKMIRQIIICLLIYTVFYLINSNNYIFSEDFINKTREILSQDINFSQIYSSILNTINQDNINHIEQQEKENQQQPTEEQKTIEEIQNNNENIGGAEELPTIEQQNVENIEASEKYETEQVQEIQELSQMEKDANYIKSSINFIKPVNGTISSMFGLRNPTTSTVPKNHTGTDIAAVTGTKIISATDGTVISASSKGDYGKHLKIQINDVIIVYAHCNKLYVNEGEVIKQGQEIAEVGATGNTTGPHLHFEVRYQDRYVDPQLILEL